MAFLTRLGNWLKDHVDLALVLAAATEIPRWTVAFLAINEPLWVGVPLGALLAWALKEGWTTYFRTKQVVVLALNLAALATAILVITPVLYAMTYVPVDEVDLSIVFGGAIDIYRMAWAGLLALSTFLPLIQISAVRSFKQDVVAEDKSDKSGVADKPKRTPKQNKPVITEADTEALLSDVDMTNGTPANDIMSFWQAAYVRSGKKVEADKMTGQQFGKSQRTVARLREGWQMLA